MKRRKSFFVESIKDQVFEYTLVSRGLELNFWNTVTGNWCGKMDLPKGFKHNPDSFQSKNCQVSESEIAFGDAKGNVIIKDILNTKFPPKILKEHQEQIRVICGSYELNPRKEVFLTGAEDDTIILWSRKMGKKMFAFDDHKNTVTDIVFSRYDCSQFATTSKDGTVKVFDLKNTSCSMTFADQTGHSISSTVDEYSNANTSPILFSTGGNNTVKMYNVNRKRKMNQIRGYDDAITSIRCFPEKHRLIAADVSGTLYCTDWRSIKTFLWKIEDKNMIKVTRIIPNKVNRNHFICCKDMFIQIHDLETGLMKKQMKEKESVFGIFSFKNKEFSASKLGTQLNLSRNLVRLRDEFVESQNPEIFEEINKNRGKVIKDNLAISITRQVEKVEKLRNKRVKKIFKVYAAVKMLKKNLKTISEEFEKEKRYYMDLLAFFPHCMQNTQVDVEKIEDFRIRLIKDNPLVRAEKMTKSQLKGQFTENLGMVNENIEKIKKDIKHHWNDFHQLRNFIWKKIVALKYSSAILDDFDNNKKHLYAGSVRNNKAEGLGVVFLKKNGFTKIFEGFFKAGKREGKGIEFSDDGEGNILYEGYYSKNVRHGRGVEFIVKTENCVSGQWKKGALSKLDDKTSPKFKFRVFPFKSFERYLVPPNVIENRTRNIVKSVVFKLPKRKGDLSILIYTLANLDLESTENIRTVYRNHIRRWASLPPNENMMGVQGVMYSMNKMGCIYNQPCSYDASTLIFEKKLKNVKDKINIILQIAKGLKHIHGYDSFFVGGFNLADILISDAFHKEEKATSHHQATSSFGGGKERRDSFSLQKKTKLKINDENFEQFKVKLHQFDTGEGFFDIKYHSYHSFNPLFKSQDEQEEGEDRRKKKVMDDIFSFGLVVFCMLFETLDPYTGISICPECHVKISGSASKLTKHIRECGLRPYLDPFLMDKYIPKNVYDWLIVLMDSMWSIDLKKRPSLDNIIDYLKHYKTVKIIDIFRNKEIKKRGVKRKKYAIEQQTVLLVETSIEALIKTIEHNFGEKVKKVYEYHAEEKKSYEDYESYQDEEEEEETEEIEGEGENIFPTGVKRGEVIELSKKIELIAFFAKCVGRPRVFVEFEKGGKGAGGGKERSEELSEENIKESKKELIEQINKLEEDVQDGESKFKKEKKKLKQSNEELNLEKLRIEGENRKLIGSTDAMKKLQSGFQIRIKELEKSKSGLEKEKIKKDKELESLKEEAERLRRKVKRLQSEDESSESGGNLLSESDDDDDNNNNDVNDSDDDDAMVESEDEDLIILDNKKDIASGIWESHAGENIKSEQPKVEEKKEEKLTGGKLKLGTGFRKPRKRGGSQAEEKSPSPPPRPARGRGRGRGRRGRGRGRRGRGRGKK